MIRGADAGPGKAVYHHSGKSGQNAAQSVLVGTGPLAAFCSAKRRFHGRLAFDVRVAASQLR